ncbi:hypothetical protein QR680_015506 [Steinernema hermaphroditum]|uniref:Uncharacterized protein n=1 Tax=Steinernema hermaphroditum TaxID=289476 RepID=A0AA39LKU2_9BILA|nr:hypothetical protein QR680_015506 [Steinernema hermaphroditum]
MQALRLVFSHSRSLCSLTGAAAISGANCKPAGQIGLQQAMFLSTAREDNNDQEQFLRRERIPFSFGGNQFNLVSVIQDTHPEGSDVGTVVAMHGAPGSHKDFKYVMPLLKEKGIRFIGINFPGYDLTEGHDKLIQHNMERVNYVQAVVDHLNLKKDVVFFGHSRGCENALKMAALNEDKTVGLVLANFFGIRVHKGIKPTWLVNSVEFLWQLGWTRFAMRPALYYIYNSLLKLRCRTGDIAAWCIVGIVPRKVDVAGQEPFVHKLNRTNIKSLLVYSGKDHLVESHISRKFAHLFEGTQHFQTDTKVKNDPEARKQVLDAFKDGARSVSIYFTKEDHFTQKHQAQLLADGIAELLSKKIKKTAPKHDHDHFLRKERIPFSFGGKQFDLESVIQDTHPEGSDVGTVVAMHGAPGSHKDFKYVMPLLKEKGIRFIGINFPGYGLSEGHDSLIQHNMERVNYVQAVVDHLNLTKDLIFLGHSRGCDNALRMAALNEDKTIGLVMSNFVGVRIHNGIRPTWLVNSVMFLWQLGWPRIFMRPILDFHYNKILKLRCPTGDVAAWSVIGVAPRNFDVAGQEPFVHKLNRTNIRSLLVYAGKDFLIESDIARQFAHFFQGAQHFETKTKAKNDERAREQVVDALRDGARCVSMFFEHEDHFCQKHQARLLADGIGELLAKKSTDSGCTSDS